MAQKKEILLLLLRGPDTTPETHEKNCLFEVTSGPLSFKQRIAKSFNQGDWIDLGALTGNTARIEQHSRLFRSMRFGDDDYEGYILPLLEKMIDDDFDNLRVIQECLDAKYPEEDVGTNASTVPSVGRRIYFTPSVFSLPDVDVDRSLISAMMPFDAGFSAVYDSIVAAAEEAGMRCERADNIWEHSVVIQDIFSLIFRSHIVICDFTGKNPNVFYEAGIAHTLGKHVIPITQSADDVPFDLRHQRYLKYLNNREGRKNLQAELAKRLMTILQT